MRTADRGGDRWPAPTSPARPGPSLSFRARFGRARCGRRTEAEIECRLRRRQRDQARHCRSGFGAAVPDAGGVPRRRSSTGCVVASATRSPVTVVPGSTWASSDSGRSETEKQERNRDRERIGKECKTGNSRSSPPEPHPPRPCHENSPEICRNGHTKPMARCAPVWEPVTGSASSVRAPPELGARNAGPRPPSLEWSRPGGRRRYFRERFRVEAFCPASLVDLTALVLVVGFLLGFAVSSSGL